MHEACLPAVWPAAARLCPPAGLLALDLHLLHECLLLPERVVPACPLLGRLTYGCCEHLYATPRISILLLLAGMALEIRL